MLPAVGGLFCVPVMEPTSHDVPSCDFSSPPFSVSTHAWYDWGLLSPLRPQTPRREPGKAGCPTELGLACGKDHLGLGAIGVEAQHEAAGGGGRSGVEETFELRQLPSGGLD